MKKISLIIGSILILIAASGIVMLFFNKPDSTESTGARDRYVALGDSVAAGVGLKGDSDSSACGRTDESYPKKVANEMGYDLVDIACTAATLQNGINGVQDVNGLSVGPQIEQLLKETQPRLISFTIGANDAGWVDVIGTCYVGNCNTPEEKYKVGQNLQQMALNLSNTLNQIGAYYMDTPPTVVVTGYHQVFPKEVTGTCRDLTGIDADEISWGRQMQEDINARIKTVVGEYEFAEYVPVDFGGHELCTNDPWVQGLSDRQPYHPTEPGQDVFAKEIIKRLESIK